MAINVYASSVAKSVFVWVCLVLLIIGWYFTIIGVKILSNKSAISDSIPYGDRAIDAAEKALTATPGVGTAGKVLLGVSKYGGIVVSVAAMSLLIIIELFWRPQRNFEHCDAEVTKLAKQSHCNKNQ